MTSFKFRSLLCLKVTRYHPFLFPVILTPDLYMHWRFHSFSHLLFRVPLWPSLRGWPCSSCCLFTFHKHSFRGQLAFTCREREEQRSPKQKLWTAFSEAKEETTSSTYTCYFEQKNNSWLLTQITQQSPILKGKGTHECSFVSQV